MSWYLQPSRMAHPRALVPGGWLSLLRGRGEEMPEEGPPPRPRGEGEEDEKCSHLKTMTNDLEVLTWSCRSFRPVYELHVCPHLENNTQI